VAHAGDLQDGHTGNLVRVPQGVNRLPEPPIAAKVLAVAAVLFIHGAFVGGWCWAGWRKLFQARGLRSAAPDLRHHGSKDAGDERVGALSLRDYLADLEALIERMEAPPVVIGHSMGGLLAQQLAARGRVAGAILLAPAKPWGVPPTGPFELGSAAYLARIRDYWRKPIRPDFGTAAEYALERLPPEARLKAYEGFVPESGRALFEMLHWPMDWTMASHVEQWRVRCPMLVLAAERDRMMPPTTVRLIAAKYAHVSAYREAPRAGHWLIGEPGWEKLAEECAAWAAQRLTPRRGAAR
jgi:non-heme chloroperoxidase